MSIVCETEFGWLIDHQQAINKSYEACHDQKTIRKFVLNPELFDIKEKFMMDSQFSKLMKCSEFDETGKLTDSMKKKRKRKHNKTEKQSTQKESQADDYVFKAYRIILEKAESLKYFMEKKPMSDNNLSARSAAQVTGSGDSLKMLCDEPSCVTMSEGGANISFFEDSGYCAPNECVNISVTNQFTHSAIVNIMGHEYLMPAESTFLLSDIKQIHALSGRILYDLIVIDPPWFNKSVKRKKSYGMIYDDDLLTLPIKEMAREGCIIAVWVTNKCKQQDYVIEELFPCWSVTFVGHWYWIKVTKSGELVSDLFSEQKKPFESLIIGRMTTASSFPNEKETSDACETRTASSSTSGKERTCPDYSTGSDSLSNEKFVDDSHSDSKTNQSIRIPPQKVLVSVPCSLHSKKPPLGDVFQRYLPSEPKCLELFARNLCQGWTSWGNEVLLHQHLDFFKEIDL